MLRRAWLLVCLVGLAGCGSESRKDAGGSEPVGHWRFATIQDLSGASGLTLHEDTLIAVAGAGDRDVYAVAVGELVDGGSAHARKLAVDIKPDAPLMGAETFAVQGYTMRHLWESDVDFQAVAAQLPNLLYVADRRRRVIFWGPMHRSVGGRIARVQFNRLTAAPGADRKDAESGDWRDKGPGITGLVSVPRAGRLEDLYLLEAGEEGQPLQVRRLDRYGSNLGGVRARHELTGPPDARALSWDDGRLVAQVGSGRGLLVTLRPPTESRIVSVPEIRGVPGPERDGVEGWTGLVHGPDGTVYLVSGGDPAVVAWRGP